MINEKSKCKKQSIGNIEFNRLLDEENIDKYILDSSVDSINPSVPKKILYASDTGEDNITNHCKMPTGEILYYVNNEWIDYNATLDTCGLSKLKKYIKDKALSQVYGTAAKARHQKNLDEMIGNLNKRKRSETRALINRLVKRNSGKDQKININDMRKKRKKTLFENKKDKEVTVKVSYIDSSFIPVFRLNANHI